MTPIADILGAARPVAGGFVADVPDDWMQGRTSYGGLSSALALEAARRLEPELPPLRSAQIAFIGPLAGAVTVAATRLRRGRTAAFVQSDVMSDAGLGLRATFVFMAPQPSRAALSGGLATTLRPPPPDVKPYVGPDGFFTGNFEFVDLKAEAPGAAEWRRWVRLRGGGELDPAVELMAIGDALPPAALKLYGKEFVPLSSLTWIVNLLTPAPATRDGWWLLHAASEHAVDGASSQTMTVWNADGVAVAQGMQSVALFG